jgi:hypothetical protein
MDTLIARDLELKLRRRIERLQLALQAAGLSDEHILAITHDGEGSLDAWGRSPENDDYGTEPPEGSTRWIYWHEHQGGNMNPLQRISEMKADAQELNAEVKEVMPVLTLLAARKMEHEIRETIGWLQGVQKMLSLEGL